MVAPRPPPKISRSPPPSSSSASPPPPSTSSAPASSMGKIVRIPRRDGQATTTIVTTTTGNNASTGAATTRPGASTLRTISTTSSGARQVISRRPSPAAPASDAAAQTLDGANPAPTAPAAENPPRSGFVLRRDSVNVTQQLQAGTPGARPGWKRRRPIHAEAATATAAAASSGSQGAPEAKRLQADRREKTESGNGVAQSKPLVTHVPVAAPSSAASALPKLSTPHVPVAPSTAASASVPAVAERRNTASASAPADEEGKASPPAASSDPSLALPRQARGRAPSPTLPRQSRDRVPSPTLPLQSRDREPSPTLPLEGKDRDLSDLTTPPPDPVVDSLALKSVVSDPAVDDVIAKTVAAVDDTKPTDTTMAMFVDTFQESKDNDAADAIEGEISSGDNGQFTEFNVNEDAESSEFLAMLEKSAEAMRISSLWIGEALQSIRDDISKAAATDAGQAHLGDLLRMSITDLFEPAAERTRAIREAADGFGEGVERYSAEGGEGRSDMAIAS